MMKNLYYNKKKLNGKKSVLLKDSPKEESKYRKK